MIYGKTRDKKWGILLFSLILICAGTLFQGTKCLAATDKSVIQTAVKHRTTGWVKNGSSTYYFTKGVKRIGWLKYRSKWYYLTPSSGKLVKGKKFTVNKKTYSASSTGARQNGWILYGSKFYYFGKQTYALQKNMWLNFHNKLYYVKSDGTRAIGKTTISGNTYYFGTDGNRQTGWISIGKNKYYFKKSNGVLQKGKWLTLSSKKYYLKKDGSRSTGIKDIGDVRYFFTTEGVLHSSSGWISYNNEQYYVKTGGVLATSTYINGKYVNFEGVYLASYCQASKTIKGFLQNATKAIGNTLYVWGGGHEYGENGVAGIQTGWKQFWTTNNVTYDYKKFRYKSYAGLDCSGFTGWSIYNNIYYSSGNPTTTTTSTYFPTYLERNGWGTKSSITKAENAKYKPGDVVSKSGHVWIIIGQCSDGSVVITHDTPPYTQISGTCTPSGNYSSEAITLANKYMKNTYKTAYSKFNKISNATKEYLFGSTVNRFSWTISSNSKFTDPQGYRNMTASQVLKDMYGY